MPAASDGCRNEKNLTKAKCWSNCTNFIYALYKNTAELNYFFNIKIERRVGINVHINFNISNTMNATIKFNLFCISI